MSESVHGTTLAALRAADAALRAGQRERALAIAGNACAGGLEHFVLLTLAAQHELARGDPDKAIVFALRARSLNPRNGEVLNTLGIAYATAGRHRDALDAFEAALRASPAAWPVRFNKASALQELQEYGRARAEFERVLEAQPRHVDALVSLAALAIQRGDIAEGRRRAQAALAIDPSQRWGELTLAAADIEDGSYDAARARLERRGLLADADPSLRSVAQNIMGDALDGMGRTGEAFGMYIAAKNTQIAFGTSRVGAADRETAAQLVARLKNYFSNLPAGKWCGGADQVARPSDPAHVFIVGFPRSGTTLLGQILASRAGVEVMDERSCLTASQERFTVPPDGLDRLASLADDGLASWRDDYWKRVAGEGHNADREVFIDKMPFYCVFLCLIARLFPRAKILFVIRDPRDVILSCLRKRFVMTEQMRELASLETAAAHYDAVMSLCETYRRTLALEILDIRYEDLVDNFDFETRRICSFLGLDWQPGIREFARRAAKHATGTPSGPQLARGLLTDRQELWRRYSEQLSSAMPRLMPWIERFGYASD